MSAKKLGGETQTKRYLRPAELLSDVKMFAGAAVPAIVAHLFTLFVRGWRARIDSFVANTSTMTVDVEMQGETARSLLERLV